MMAVRMEQLNEEQPWISYTEKMYVECTQQSSVFSTTYLKLMYECFKRQKAYLQCSGDHPPLSFGESHVKVAYFHQNKPCGWIQLPRGGHKRVELINWEVVVNSAFHLNLTFYHFRLPMAHGSCQLMQTTEFVSLGDLPPALASSGAESVLCGSKVPYSLIWDDYTLQMAYKRQKNLQRRGSIIIHYQVCEKNLIHHSTHILKQTALSDGINSVDLKYKHFNPKAKGWMKYPIHIIGDRISVVSLAVSGVSFYSGDKHIRAYDAPGPIDIHRYPYSPVTWNSLLLYNFATFQCFVEIYCEVLQCDNIDVYYSFEATIGGAVHLLLERDSFNQIKYPSHSCQSQIAHEYSSLLFCTFQLHAAAAYLSIQVSFETISYIGPDLSGHLPSDYRCLLAGVTVVDSYRMKLYHSFMEKHGSVPQRVIADNVLPEITTCHDVAKVDSLGKVSYDLQLKTFTSTTDSAIVIIYAYGGYINLDASVVGLNISTTYCTGVFIGCPVLYGDGFWEITNGDPLYTNALFEVSKTYLCSSGHMLLIPIQPKQGEKYIFFLVYCTHHDTRSTHSRIFSDIGAFLGLCFIVQSNPFFGHTWTPYIWTCLYTDTDTTLWTLHHFDTSVVTYSSIFCETIQHEAITIMKSVFHGNGSNEFEEVPIINNRVEESSIIQMTTYISQCVNFQSLVSSPCSQMEVVDSVPFSSLLTYSGFTEAQRPCLTYDIPTSANLTHMIKVPHTSFSHIMQALGNDASFLGDASTDRLNHNLAYTQLHIILSSSCSNVSRLLTVRIFYQLALLRMPFALKFHAYVSQNKPYAIDLSQLPLSGWLVYITSTTDSSEDVRLSSTESYKCTTGVNISRFSDDTLEEKETQKGANYMNEFPFATYHYIWTYERYTWHEAENICAEQNMHLTSITSETEYQLIVDLLSGNNSLRYQRAANGRLLTLCRIEAALCVVYIGLQQKVQSRTKVGRIS